jgi:hypothetical protein
VSSKKVSSCHCEFLVGKYTVDDVVCPPNFHHDSYLYFEQGDPTKRPTIEFINKKDKGMRIMRGDLQIDINPSASHELQHGDVVTIVSGGLIM